MTVTGGFAGEHDGVREFFDSDEFDDVVTGSYVSAGGESATTKIFCTYTIDNGDEGYALSGSMVAAYYDCIVGRDHIASPGADDIFTVTDPNGTSLSVGDQIRMVGIAEGDGDTVRLIGELV